MINQEKIRQIYLTSLEITREKFSKYATLNEEAKRKREEPNDYLRSDFAIDRDRILHSGAYRRYQGKTQVFSFTNMYDEEMTNRSLHTTYVSQISRTIGKRLGLNLELIEAIALGHDLGHTPFGHDGEVALSSCCQQHEIGHFHHNVQSLHIIDNISSRGNGLNLTYQVRDGIISHDGEVHNTILKPQKDKTEDDINRYVTAKKNGEHVKWMPATMEGCVVRISDTIAYIGMDIEDAIRYRILSPDDLPEECTAYLGRNNSQIIDTLVKSVVANSYGKDYVCFDEETSHHLLQLKKFNYEKIYTNQDVKNSREIIQKSMAILFEQYLADIKNEDKTSRIFTQFLNRKNENYQNNFSAAEKVRDFIATMTDRYFNEEIKRYLVPGTKYY